MTTAKRTQKFRLLDAPEYPEDRMTNFDHLTGRAAPTIWRSTWATLGPPWWPVSATWSSGPPAAWREAGIPTFW